MLFNEGAFIQIDQTRCLNHQHNDIGCTHCVLHCPGQALVLNKNSIHLDKDKCMGCGLCFSDCPTEVFSAKQWDETTVLAEVKYQDAKGTQFFCEYHEVPYLSKEEKDKGAIQIPTCLSSLSKGVWYELGLMTEVELRLEKCQQCQMKQCLERLKLTINTAMEWLIASGHTPNFSYLYKEEKIQKKKKLKAVSTGMKVTSRRDLFLSLLGQGKEVVQHIREKDNAFYPKKRRKIIFSLPNWQKRLEQSYTTHFHEGGTPAYWPSIQKNAKCVNCGMCSNHCPTQALKIKVEDGKAVHVFTSGHCIDCRMCMLYCPTESITRDRHPNSKPFEIQTIYEAPVIECERCGNSTFENEQNLCYWCENEASASAMISDVWSHLFEKKEEHFYR